MTLGEMLGAGSLLALVSGAIIYSFHRTVTNPWIEILRYGWSRKAIQNAPWFRKYLLCEDAVDVLVDRWDCTLRQDVDKVGEYDFLTAPARYRGLSAWSDYIHLFYCSGISLILGSLFSCAYWWDFLTIDWLQATLIVFFLGFGFLSDVRRQYVEDRCIETPARLTDRRG